MKKKLFLSVLGASLLGPFNCALADVNLSLGDVITIAGERITCGESQPLRYFYAGNPCIPGQEIWGFAVSGDIKKDFNACVAAARKQPNSYDYYMRKGAACIKAGSWHTEQDFCARVLK